MQQNKSKSEIKKREYEYFPLEENVSYNKFVMENIAHSLSVFPANLNQCTFPTTFVGFCTPNVFFYILPENVSGFITRFKKY